MSVQMIISDAKNQDVETLADIGANVFINDSFYKCFSNKKEQGKKELKELFIKSIDICLSNGIVKTVSLDGNICAFVLAFNYKKLRVNNFDAFNHFFLASNKKHSESLTRIKNGLEQAMQENIDYIYILSIAVAPEYQKKGICKALIQKMLYDYSEYGFITDASNPVFSTLCENFGFKKVNRINGCDIEVLAPKEHSEKIGKDIYVILPSNSNLLIDKDIFIKNYVLENVIQFADSWLFKKSLFDKTIVNVYKVAVEEILHLQSMLAFSSIVEKTIKINNYNCLYYCIANNEINSFNNDKNMDSNLESTLFPDVITMIPMSYGNEQTITTENSYYSARFLEALAFRTTYETGIPGENDEINFKSRIKRFSLGHVTIQLLTEKTLNYCGKNEQEVIGTPFEAMIMVSVDKLSKIAVVYLVALSFKNKVTQYLDSVSRNQLDIISNNGQRENIYKFLYEKYGLNKVGNAINFVAISKNKEDLPKELIASALWGETYYQPGEGLGQIIDKKLKWMIETPHGISQYDYADFLLSSTVAIHLSSSLFNTIESRIIRISTSLFYIELVMFETAAINLADIKIKNTLSLCNSSSPVDILKEYGKQMREYASTIDFWDVKMNYPSSQISLENYRKYFNLQGLYTQYKGDLDIFEKVYNSKSDYSEKIESKILTAFGAILTTISILELVLNLPNYYLLPIAGVIVVSFTILKDKIFYKKRRKKKDKK